MLSRDDVTGDQPVGSMARILKPDKSKLKRVLKWIVIVNAGLAAIGIVIGRNGDFVAQIHGTSLLLVLTAASLVAIEQGRFRSELRYVWPVGSACSTVVGLVVVTLVWGFQPPDVFARPVGSMAVVAVAVTYCAVISVIADRVRLRLVCWVGALGHSCYVLVLIWFEVGLMPGTVLALMGVGQTACSLLVVIDFMGSRRAASVSSRSLDRKAKFCPYCGDKELVGSDGKIGCKNCGGEFQIPNS